MFLALMWSFVFCLLILFTTCAKEDFILPCNTIHLALCSSQHSRFHSHPHATFTFLYLMSSHNFQLRPASDVIFFLSAFIFCDFSLAQVLLLFETTSESYSHDELWIKLFKTFFCYSALYLQHTAHRQLEMCCVLNQQTVVSYFIKTSQVTHSILFSSEQTKTSVLFLLLLTILSCVHAVLFHVFSLFYSFLCSSILLLFLFLLFLFSQSGCSYSFYLLFLLWSLLFWFFALLVIPLFLLQC